MKLAPFYWIAAVSVSAGVLAEEPLALEYRFVKGKTRTFQVTNILQKRTELGTNAIKNPITTQTTFQQITFDSRVDSVADDGSATMMVTFRDASIKFTSTNTPQDDTALTQQGQAMIAPIVGKSVVIAVDRLGEIKKIVGVEAIQKAIVETQKGELNREGARIQFDEYYFVQLLQAAQPVVTEDSLSVGEKWPAIDNVPLGFEDKQLVRAIYYSLTGIKDGFASLSIVGKLTLLQPTGLDADPQRQNIVELLSGDVSGASTFDPILGCFRLVRLQMDFSLKFSVSNPNDPNRPILGLTDTRKITESTLITNERRK